MPPAPLPSGRARPGLLQTSSAQTRATRVCSCPQEGLPSQPAAADFLSWVSSSAWRQLDGTGSLAVFPAAVMLGPGFTRGMSVSLVSLSSCALGLQVRRLASA